MNCNRKCWHHLPYWIAFGSLRSITLAHYSHGCQNQTKCLFFMISVSPSLSKPVPIYCLADSIVFKVYFLLLPSRCNYTLLHVYWWQARITSGMFWRHGGSEVAGCVEFEIIIVGGGVAGCKCCRLSWVELGTRWNMWFSTGRLQVAGCAWIGKMLSWTGCEFASYDDHEIVLCQVAACMCENLACQITGGTGWLLSSTSVCRLPLFGYSIIVIIIIVMIIRLALNAYPMCKLNVLEKLKWQCDGKIRNFDVFHVC